MRIVAPLVFNVLFLTSAGTYAQVTLNSNPTRVIGQLQLGASAQNLVEGRELSSPQGIAIDTAASPPVLYVADTGNNRVLAWRNASSFANGAAADFVIGQRDRMSTQPQGPGSAFSVGLSSPTGLAVKNGDLYVVDSGNNRVLRYPKPALQPDTFPDLVIGQPGFNTRAPNNGGVSAASLSFINQDGNPVRGWAAFDSGGNLYISDAGNRRVLRYSAAATAANVPNGPAADLVLGAPDFTTISRQMDSSDPQTMLARDKFFQPAGIVVDGAGNIYVADYDWQRRGAGRALVFTGALFNGVSATRIMGIAQRSQQNPSQPAPGTERTVLLQPEGVFLVGDRLAVVDVLTSRVLIFDPLSQWPAESVTFSPAAVNVLGQGDYTTLLPNRGRPEPAQNSLAFPVAAAASSTEVFIADSANNRVLVFSRDNMGPNASASRVLGQEGFQYNAPNLIQGREFNFLTQTRRGVVSDAGIVVDTRGATPYLYIADTYNNRVLGFRDARRVRAGDRADLVIGQPDAFRSLCNYPSGDPQKPTDTGLCAPVGLALDEQGNLYVADSGNGRVLRFPRPFAQQTQRADLVLGQLGMTVRIADASSRTMAAPYGLAFLPNQGLLVSDLVHNRVLFFAGSAANLVSSQAAAKVFGQPDFVSTSGGSTDNRMSGPHHIAIDDSGRLYVTDSDNQRVLIFSGVAAAASSDARAAAVLTASLRGAPLRGPHGVFVSPATGEIWVAEAGNDRVVKYPSFDGLPLAQFLPSDTQVLDASLPAAITLDAYGALLVADGRNRVAFYFPGMVAVNGANFLADRPLAPGAIASIFPISQAQRFSESTRAFNELPTPLPLPTELADVQVLINDQPARLYFVSPGQINFLVPMKAPSSGTVDLEVIRRSTGQTLAAGPVQMGEASPALFTAGSAGGQVAALNQDSTINSPSNPAARGTVISLFATGQGFVDNAPEDGAPAQGLIPTREKPRVIMGAAFVNDDDIQFSGLAPGFVGLWQVNVRIPQTVAPNNAVVVVLVHKGIASGNAGQIRTTIAVKQ